jgi:cytidyltransferase-like protein
MVGDLFHLGHVELLRAARAFGDWLVVGVLSDEVVMAYKRKPIMTLAERVAVIAACRYVDEVLPDAPFRVTPEFLEQHELSVVVHGDDISQQVIADVFGSIAAMGKLRLVTYTAGVSTTEIIRRVHERAREAEVAVGV